MAYSRMIELSGSGSVGGGGLGGSSTTYHAAFGTVTIPVTNLKCPVAYSIGVASGNTDLYTVPASKKALILDVVFTNPTGNAGSVTCDAQVKSSGVYHKFGPVASTATVGTFGSSNALPPFLLATGETFAVSTTASGLSVWPAILEFDATVPIFDARLFSLNAGNNTLFTVPASVTVAFIGNPSGFGFSGPDPGHVCYYNASGGTRTIQINAVPSGGPPAVANALFNTSVGNRGLSQPFLYGGLASGDFINVNTDASTASQIAWVIYTTQ